MPLQTTISTHQRLPSIDDIVDHMNQHRHPIAKLQPIQPILLIHKNDKTPFDIFNAYRFQEVAFWAPLENDTTENQLYNKVIVRNYQKHYPDYDVIYLSNNATYQLNFLKNYPYEKSDNTINSHIIKKAINTVNVLNDSLILNEISAYGDYLPHDDLNLPILQQARNKYKLPNLSYFINLLKIMEESTNV